MPANHGGRVHVEIVRQMGKETTGIHTTLRVLEHAVQWSRAPKNVVSKGLAWDVLIFFSNLAAFL